MADLSELEKICERLGGQYGDRGVKAGERLRRWLEGAIPYAYPEVIARCLEERHLPLLFDAFWQVLPFGTGGRRGPVGYGANRLNPSTVAMTVQGHVDYLRAAFSDRGGFTVVVANDVRVFRDNAGVYGFLGSDHPLLGVSSRSLAKLACEIYAANGVTAYLAEPDNDRAVISTPELSFLIVKLGADGGINLSASHNPPDDNGIKVYDAYGSQPIAPEDQRLADAMEKATDVRHEPFAEAQGKGLIRGVPPGLHREYVAAYVESYGKVYPPNRAIPIVYTPLCGCGLRTVGDVLNELGFSVLVPPGEDADGSFAVIPFKAPNPEVPQATAPAKHFADEQGARIVLSSDPDADRVGLEIKLSDDSWYHFDGNQIASILCYFLMLDPRGPQRRGLVIETLVTTKILGEIVRRAGESWLIDDLLVGFKYVADVLKTLERDGHYGNVRCSPEKLVMAAEESHGIVVLPGIRDKDATPACMYLAGLYQQLQEEGRNLLDYYADMIDELGGYDSVNRGITMSGTEGMLKKDLIMRSLRESNPETLGGVAVKQVVDYWNKDRFGAFLSETERLPRNVFQVFTDAFIITIRPSGTEPKLKLYCQLLPQPENGAVRGAALLRSLRAQANEVAKRIYNELLDRIGVSLGEAALLLPDIVDLEQKRRFETVTLPELRTRLRNAAFAGIEDVQGWLRSEAATMIPGADPLPALREPLAATIRAWGWESSTSALIRAFEDWTKGS